MTQGASVHGEATHLEFDDGPGLSGGCAERDVIVVLGDHGHDEMPPRRVQEDLMNSVRHSARQLNLRCRQCTHLEHSAS